MRGRVPVMLRRVFVSALAFCFTGCADWCWGPFDGACSSDMPVPVTNFEATLTGIRVVPPVTTVASGSARVDLLRSSSHGPYTMQYTISVTNISEAASAALYVGNSGTNGTPIVTLCSPCATSGTGVTTGTAPVSAEVITAMRTFRTYLEIRTATGPQLRGQLRVVGQ